MLEQIRQIKILLANFQSNIQVLLHERDQFIKEIEKLRKENEELRHQVDTKKSA